MVASTSSQRVAIAGAASPSVILSDPVFASLTFAVSERRISAALAHHRPSAEGRPHAHEVTA